MSENAQFWMEKSANVLPGFDESFVDPTSSSAREVNPGLQGRFTPSRRRLLDPVLTRRLGLAAEAANLQENKNQRHLKILLFMSNPPV